MPHITITLTPQGFQRARWFQRVRRDLRERPRHSFPSLQHVYDLLVLPHSLFGPAIYLAEILPPIDIVVIVRAGLRLPRWPGGASPFATAPAARFSPGRPSGRRSLGACGATCSGACGGHAGLALELPSLEGAPQLCLLFYRARAQWA